MTAKLKLDLGCGKNRKPGFIGVDSRPFEGVDKVWDLTVTPWRLCDPAEMIDGSGAVITTGLMDATYAAKEYPIIEDDAVEEVHCSHFVEHLTAPQRIAFVNELYRVLEPGGKAMLIVPHWGSCRAYGDLTHQWPPVSEFWFYYLLKSWRDQNAPHNDAYTCDFDATWGYSLHPGVGVRNQEFQQFAMTYYKESIQDIIATLTKPKKRD